MADKKFLVDLNMGGNSITALKDPVDNQDAATKKYVLDTIIPNTNNYITGMSGTGDSTVTISRLGLSNITWNAAHSHSEYLTSYTNNYLTGVTGSGDGTVTFTRQGLGNLTWSSAHTHSEYVTGGPYDNYSNWKLNGGILKTVTSGTTINLSGDNGLKITAGDGGASLIFEPQYGTTATTVAKGNHTHSQYVTGGPYLPLTAGSSKELQGELYAPKGIHLGLNDELMLSLNRDSAGDGASRIDFKYTGTLKHSLKSVGNDFYILGGTSSKVLSNADTGGKLFAPSMTTALITAEAATSKVLITKEYAETNYMSASAGPYLPLAGGEMNSGSAIDFIPGAYFAKVSSYGFEWGDPGGSTEITRSSIKSGNPTANTTIAWNNSSEVGIKGATATGFALNVNGKQRNTGNLEIDGNVTDGAPLGLYTINTKTGSVVTSTLRSAYYGGDLEIKRTYSSGADAGYTFKAYNGSVGINRTVESGYNLSVNGAIRTTSGIRTGATAQHITIKFWVGTQAQHDAISTKGATTQYNIVG